MKCPICQIKLYKEFDNHRYEEYGCCMCGSLFIKNKGKGHLPKKYYEMIKLVDMIGEFI